MASTPICRSTPTDNSPSREPSPASDHSTTHDHVASASGTRTHFTLSKEETEYLRTRLPTYVAHNNQSGRQKKGAKGQWVIENILPDFKSHFQYSSKNMDGPRMDDITKVPFPFLFAQMVGS